MATPIPAFVSMLRADASVYQIRVHWYDSGSIVNGSLQTLSQAHYYYGVSAHAAATNGQSFLEALRVALNASTAAIPGIDTPSGSPVAWHVYLGSDYILRLSHNSANILVVNMLDSAAAFSASFSALMGFTTTLGQTVFSGVVRTAEHLPRFWWSPELPVCGTGPTFFDPSLNVGIPMSASTAQQSSDGSMAFTSNGILTAAEYIFNGVQPYWRIRPQAGHVNADLETWWRYGPALGNRVLMWRNRDHAAVFDQEVPTASGPSPYRYIEYYPNDALVKDFPARPTSGYTLVFWDVGLGFNLTETGETPQ